MAYVVYRSTDASAPTLGPGAGGLIGVLRACLVGTAGVAYGSKSSAGWTEPFTSVGDVAVFRNSSSTGTGAYFRFDDSNTSGNRPVSFRGYATMSNLSTGTKATAARYTHRAHNSSGATNLSWLVIADEQTCYFTCWQSGGTSNNPNPSMIGDIESYQTADAYRYAVMGCLTSSTNSMTYLRMDIDATYTNLGVASPAATDLGLSFGSDYTGTTGSSPHAIIMPCVSGGRIIGSSYLPADPSASGAGNLAVPAYVGRGLVIRGRLRGVYLPLKCVTTGFTNAGSHNLHQTETAYGGGSSVFSIMRGGTLSAADTIGGLFIESGVAW